MAKITGEESMRKFLKVIKGSEHIEVAKAHGLAMIADAVKNVCSVLAVSGGERLNIEKHVKRVKEDRLQRLVSKQAKDNTLWFEAATAPEAHLQKALRKLHEVAEGKMQKRSDLLLEENINKVERWLISLDRTEHIKAQEALDETVHDLYDNLASQINNQGAHDQIKFVFEQCGDKAWDEFGRTWDQWEWK